MIFFFALQRYAYTDTPRDDAKSWAILCPKMLFIFFLGSALDDTEVFFLFLLPPTSSRSSVCSHRRHTNVCLVISASHNGHFRRFDFVFHFSCFTAMGPMELVSRYLSHGVRRPFYEKLHMLSTTTTLFSRGNNHHTGSIRATDKVALLASLLPRARDTQLSQL